MHSYLFSSIFLISNIVLINHFFKSKRKKVLFHPIYMSVFHEPLNWCKLVNRRCFMSTETLWHFYNMQPKRPQSMVFYSSFIVSYLSYKITSLVRGECVRTNDVRAVADVVAAKLALSFLPSFFHLLCTFQLSVLCKIKYS